MNKNHFTENSPGKLFKIQNVREDWAFIPNELPPQWEFPHQLWPLLADAKESLGTLNGIGQALPNPDLLLRPLQRREALTSSSIEGTHVTPEQLLLYELDPHEENSDAESVADWREVFNYGAALRHGCTRIKELPLCARIIREMHELLMQGVRGRNKSPGQFRAWQVQIGSNARFMPPPHTLIEGLANNLEAYMNHRDSKLDPLIQCFMVHYQFEAIHPFADGNGRVGRALLALMIYAYHNHTSPWLYLSPFFERYREEYVQNLYVVSAEGKWTQWIEFCLRGTIDQAQDSIRRCNQIKAAYDRLRRLVDDAPSTRSHAIIDTLLASPVLTIPWLVKRFNVSYPTAKTDVEALIKKGILAEIPDHHPRSFFCPDLMRIAYGELEGTSEEEGPKKKPS